MSYKRAEMRTSLEAALYGNTYISWRVCVCGADLLLYALPKQWNGEGRPTAPMAPLIAPVFVRVLPEFDEKGPLINCFQVVRQSGRTSRRAFKRDRVGNALLNRFCHSYFITLSFSDSSNFSTTSTRTNKPNKN